MAFNVLVKLADTLDRDGKQDYVKNIDKVIDKLCEGKYGQAINYLIKAADFFDNNKMSKYAEAADLAISKLAGAQETNLKREQMQIRMTDLTRKMNEAPAGPEKERLRKELRMTQKGLHNMQKMLKSLERGTDVALKRDKKDEARELVRSVMPKPGKQESGRTALQPVGPNYIVDKANFTAPLRDAFKIRRLIRQIAVGTDFLPTKYGRTIKASGPFSWPIYWVINSFRDKLNLPNGWQTAFDKRNKTLEEKDADDMMAHIADRMGGLLREAQMPQASREIIREREV